MTQKYPVRYCACRGAYLDEPTGNDWRRHGVTAQHQRHAAANLVPLKKVAK